MLSYRHSFHAGNHADVLKHVVLTELLQYLTAKPKDLWYIDTHAGAGVYELGRSAAAVREAGTGIARIWHAANAPHLVRQYLQLVERLNPAEELMNYPGSPWLARELLRPADRLWLHELHPADHAALSAVFGRDKLRVRVEKRDGLAGLRALLPPAPKRALVLVDPSYERSAEYAQVADALDDARRRFAGGVYVLWYPLLRSREAQQFARRLEAVAGSKYLHVNLVVRKARRDGMYGSGLVVVNPPYSLEDALATAMPWLVERLAQDDAARYSIDSQAG